MPGTHTHNNNNNTRHEQANKVERGLPDPSISSNCITTSEKSAAHWRFYWWNRAEQRLQTAEWQRNNRQLNITSSPLHHQEPSVFISANKFLGNPPDDFHSNLDTRWLSSSTVKGESTRKRESFCYSHILRLVDDSLFSPPTAGYRCLYPRTLRIVWLIDLVPWRQCYYFSRRGPKREQISHSWLELCRENTLWQKKRGFMRVWLTPNKRHNRSSQKTWGFTALDRRVRPPVKGFGLLLLHSLWG